MRTEELFKFIRERHSIHDQRRLGFEKPWTDDPILRNYRFCNVYRELDTQTKWFADNWRKPNADDPDLWFASLVFRFVNWHETAEMIGYPVPWKASHFVQTLRRRKDEGAKVYSGAYMISTHGVKEEKSTYLAKSLTKIWASREHIRYRPRERLESFHMRLMSCFDVGSFLAAQVVADIKYVPAVHYFAPDWSSFAASGPGSRRGLNRVYNVHINQPWKEGNWKAHLRSLKESIDPMIEDAKMLRLDAQDLQNCLCEFDKYERVRLGEGKPKQRYNGEKE